MSSSATDAPPAHVAVTMPDPGPDAADARLKAWCVVVGEEVEEGEAICIVSVDGFHAEVLSASAGRVSALLLGVGAPVEAGLALAELEPIEMSQAPQPEEAEAATQADEPAWAAEVRAWINDLRVTVELEPDPEPERAEAEPEPPQPEPKPSPASAPDPDSAPRPAPASVELSDFHSPAVRRLAAEHRIDLTGVVGTGHGGRIRKEDVLACLADRAPDRTSACGG